MKWWWDLKWELEQLKQQDRNKCTDIHQVEQWLVKLVELMEERQASLSYDIMGQVGSSQGALEVKQHELGQGAAIHQQQLEDFEQKAEVLSMMDFQKASLSLVDVGEKGKVLRALNLDMPQAIVASSVDYKLEQISFRKLLKDQE